VIVVLLRRRERKEEKHIELVVVCFDHIVAVSLLTIVTMHSLNPTSRIDTKLNQLAFLPLLTRC